MTFYLCVGILMYVVASATTQDCPSGDPLLDGYGVQYFCGLGPYATSCPSGSSCHSHSADAYAFCCSTFQFKGNSIINRGAVFPNTGDFIRSYTDTSNTLSAGILKKFHLYVHDVGRRTQITLQIWRPGNDSHSSQYKPRLFWETIWTVQNVPEEGKHVIVSVPYRTAPVIKQGDYMGWSGPSSLPISTNPNLSQAVYYRQDYVGYAPIRGEIEGYQFQPLQPMAAFSVAVEIEKLKLYGNNVTDGGAAIPLMSDAITSFIDTSHPLPVGVLKAFHVYVHDVGARSDIQLQIWKPDDVTSIFKLVWQKSVSLFSVVSGGRHYVVDIFYRQAPLIEEGDYLGWSCTGSLPIWGVPGDTEAMYYRTDPLDSGPSPGQASGYQFQTLRPAYVFPAAVEIVTYNFDPSEIIVDHHPTIYGNDVINHGRFLKDQTQFSFISSHIVLPVGILQTFYLYVHDVGMPTGVKIQVWRRMEPAENIINLKLIWEEHIPIDNVPRDGKLITVDVPRAIAPRLGGNTMIGFTNDHSVSPVSMEYSYTWGSVYADRLDTTDTFPFLNKTYQFNAIYKPMNFSIAVQVIKDTETPVTNPITVEPPIPPDELLLSSEANLFGNDVTFRGEYLQSGAMKTYIVGDTPLHEGLLGGFIIFIHKYEATTDHRLQIWRPQNDSVGKFVLVWEMPVAISRVQPYGTIKNISVPTDSAPWVKEGDLIGWTNENDVAPISFQYVAGRRMHYRSVPAVGEYPDVGTIYTMNSTTLPTTFSVAVKISPNVSESGGPISGVVDLHASNMWVYHVNAVMIIVMCVLQHW